MKNVSRFVGFAVIALVAAAVCQSLGRAADGDEKKPKHSTKQVMTIAHKDGLLKKVLAGDASHEEQHKLLDLYIDMLENKPPRGELASWHELAGKAVLASAKVVVEREGALDELKAAVNCKACHDAHKPKE